MSWGPGSPLSWPRLPPVEGAVLARRGAERRQRKEPGHQTASLECRGVGLGPQLSHH